MLVFLGKQLYTFYKHRMSMSDMNWESKLNICAVNRKKLFSAFNSLYLSKYIASYFLFWTIAFHTLLKNYSELIFKKEEIYFYWLRWNGKYGNLLAINVYLRFKCILAMNFEETMQLPGNDCQGQVWCFKSRFFKKLFIQGWKMI
jgi:flagellar biosynthesis protein FlhB